MARTFVTYDDQTLRLVYTSDGTDGSGVVSGIVIGRKFCSSESVQRKRNRYPRFQRKPRFHL